MKEIKPSEFIAAPPARKSFRDLLKWTNVSGVYKRFFYFIALIFGVYDDKPLDPTELSPSSPRGQIGEGQLKLCQGIYDEAKERDEKLGQKSTSTLSLVAILVPLIVSALIYIGTVSTLKTVSSLFCKFSSGLYSQGFSLIRLCRNPLYL